MITRYRSLIKKQIYIKKKKKLQKITLGNAGLLFLLITYCFNV